MIVFKQLSQNWTIADYHKIRRHLIPKPGEVNSFYRWDDLNLGMDVEIYGVTYHIVDCDEFTKNFFNHVEIQLNRNEEFPYDPFLVNQEKTKPHPRTTTTQDPEKLALRQFLRNDRKVLRFYAVLDNRNESFGHTRQFIIQYYLSDDTTRVNEVYKNNSGYLEFPTFCRRQRIPKKVQGVVMDEP
ncbi:MAG: putative EF-hand domain-containing protein [Streblomastix strix]|uniref:Putative EF-hand domain-containing protein n=1 Tax=Streblomastix strix TaxID=222440 RepID=A0A5J4WYC0_9EUKA|nr:MAG: putative EF-hand domain-containing protein [Streblomastix strix]